MPTVTEQETTAYAHCTAPRCPGSQQQEVKATRVETSHTYRERGGEGPGIEASFVDLVFADDDERACSSCGRPRELSDQPRKRYAALSGHDPMGLLGVAKFDPAAQQERREELRSQGVDPDKQRLEDENRQLMERLAALEQKLDKPKED